MPRETPWRIVGMLIAAFFASTAPGFFACKNTARVADDFTFFALLAVATAVFAGLQYGLVRHRPPLRRSMLVLIGAGLMLLIAIPVGAVMTFGGCGHFRM